MIRPATLADVPRVVEMGLTFAASSEYASHFTARAEAVEAFMTSLVTSDSALLLVAERDGGLVGMIGMALHAHPFTGERTAAELFWWVEPTARGSLGLRLLKQAEAWAIADGATAIVMIAPNETVEQLYTALGYRQVETTYQRRV